MQLLPERLTKAIGATVVDHVAAVWVVGSLLSFGRATTEADTGAVACVWASAIMPLARSSATPDSVERTRKVCSYMNG